MTDLSVFWLLVFFVYAGLDAAAQNTSPASSLTEESHADTLSQNNLKTHISASNLNGHIELTTLKILLTTFPSKIDVTNDNSTSIDSEQRKSDENRRFFEDILENPPYSEYSSDYDSNEDTNKSASSLSSSYSSEEDEEAAAKGSTDGLKSNDVINGSETSGNFVAINGELGSEIPPANKAPLSGNYNFKNDTEEKGDVPIAADEGASTMEMDDQESLFAETGEESDESLFELNDPTEENWFGNITYEESESAYSPRETISELEDIRKLLTKTATERPDVPEYSTEVSDIEIANGQEIERKLENNEDSGSINAEEAEYSDSFSSSEESFELSTTSTVNSDIIEPTESTPSGSESSKGHQSTTIASEENIATTEILTDAVTSKIIDEESVEKYTSEDISSYESILSPTIMPARNQGATPSDDSNHKANTDGDFVIVVDDIYSSSESDEDDPKIYFDNLSTENPSEGSISEIQEDRIEKITTIPVNANENVSEQVFGGITEATVKQENEEFSTTAGGDDQTEQDVATEDTSSYADENEGSSDSSSYSTENDNLSTENPSEDNNSDIQEDSVQKITIIPVNANENVSEQVAGSITEATMVQENKEYSTTTGGDDQTEQTVATEDTSSYTEDNEGGSDSSSYSTEDTSEEISCEVIGNCTNENSTEIDPARKVEESVEVSKPFVETNTQEIQYNKDNDITNGHVIENAEESSTSAAQEQTFLDTIKEFLTDSANQDNISEDNSDSTEEENNPETTHVNIVTEKEGTPEMTTLSKNIEFDNIASITTSEASYLSGDNEEDVATESESLIGNLLKSIVEEMIQAANSSSELYESMEDSTEDNPKISDTLITLALMNDSTTEATEVSEGQATDYPFLAIMELLEEVLAAEDIPTDFEDENSNVTTKTTSISDDDLYAPTTEALTSTRVPKNLADLDGRRQDGIIKTDSSLDATTEKVNKTIYDFKTPEEFSVVVSEESPSESSKSTKISPEETLVVESPIIDDREKPVEYPSYSFKSDEYVTEENTSREDDHTTRQREIESITDNAREKLDIPYLQTDSIESEVYTENFFVEIPEEFASDSLDSTIISSEETESNESVTDTFNYEKILKVFTSGTQTSFLEEDIEPNQEDIIRTTILEQTTEVTTERRIQFKDFAEIVISSEELSSEQSDMTAPDVALSDNNTDTFLNYTEIETPGENATLSEVLNYIYQRFLASLLELETAENSTSAAVQDENGESTEAVHETDTNEAKSDKSEVALEEIYVDESIYSDAEEDSNTSDKDNEETDLISSEGEEDEKVTNINQSEEVGNEGSHIQEHDSSEDQSNDVILDGEHVPYIIGKALQNDVNISIKIIAEDVTFYVPPYAYLLEDLDNLVLNITWSSPNKILNNSLSLTLTQISKYYVIHGVQLNIVRDNEMLAWKKNVVILPKKVDEAGKYDCVVDFEDGVMVSISNIDFLKSNVKGNINNESDVHSSTTNASGRRILHIEIASGCMGIALILSAILYVVITKSRKRSLKSKGASVQHVAA